MTNVEELKDRASAKLQTILDKRAVARVRYPALLGQSNTTGSALVRADDDEVYVRLGSDEVPARALNTITPHRNGLSVWVAEREDRLGALEVVGVRRVYHQESPDQGGLRAHHKQHELGLGSTGRGEDVVYVQLRQITDFRISAPAGGGKNVDIEGGSFRLQETPGNYAGETFDITSYWPVLGYKWVTLALTGSGTIDVTESLEKLDLDYTDIPDPADGDYWVLGAVRVQASVSTITDTPTNPNIVDLRFSSLADPSGSGAVTHKSLSDTPSTWPTAYQSLRVNSGKTALELHDKIVDIPFTIGDGTNVITTGVKAYVPLDFYGTIDGHTLAALQSGSIVIDIWNANGSIPTNGNTITNGNEPTLSGAQYGTVSDVSGWSDLSIEPGDVLGINVDSVATITRVTLTLKVIKR